MFFLLRIIGIIHGDGVVEELLPCSKFAYPVVLLARSQSSLDPLVQGINQDGGSAIGIPADVTDAGSINSTLKHIEQQFGSDLTVSAAVFNVASKFTRVPFLDSGSEASNFSKAVLPLMLRAASQVELRHPPTMIVTGATAAMKGGSGLGSFAMSKFAVRALSQSLAHESGPKGVHVAHAIIDWIIATEKTKSYKNDMPDAKIDPN
ncbi:hypothetical protein BDV39DRAFT_196944 [Aspergillus sergii]|uniref:NAD(P)-binding protein n=1 Tax=Aspergillus sergii TaxID=1034303 RepID=A0A5N6WPF2_9EURO|nr:hypothetical protein BDV39DRAFT_196944 [Aspergillus sergii]